MGSVRVGPFDSAVVGIYLLTHMVYLLPFLSYLAGSKIISDHPTGPRPTRTRRQLPLKKL